MTGVALIIRIDIGQRLVARAFIGVGQLARRQVGRCGDAVETPPGPDQTPKHTEKCKLEQKAKNGGKAAQFSNHAATEQKTDHAGAEKPGSKSTEPPW